MKRSFELEKEECGITKKPSLDANDVDFVFLPLNNFLNDVIINFLYDKKNGVNHYFESLICKYLTIWNAKIYELLNCFPKLCNLGLKYCIHQVVLLVTMWFVQVDVTVTHKPKCEFLIVNILTFEPP
jgi:hypothetical protein